MEMKEHTAHKIKATDAMLLQRVMEDHSSRLQEYITCCGKCIQHFTLKMHL
jgi:hypothetical protein